MKVLRLHQRRCLEKEVSKQPDKKDTDCHPNYSIYKHQCNYDRNSRNWQLLYSWYPFMTVNDPAVDSVLQLKQPHFD